MRDKKDDKDGVSKYICIEHNTKWTIRKDTSMKSNSEQKSKSGNAGHVKTTQKTRWILGRKRSL